jgi:hypothetical protein
MVFRPFAAVVLQHTVLVGEKHPIIRIDTHGPCLSALVVKGFAVVNHMVNPGHQRRRFSGAAYEERKETKY